MTFVLLSSGVREALQSIPHLCTEILGNNLCMEMTSFDGIYRMFFISALYHLILAVLLFDYGCNQKTQDSLQNHFWITKSFLFVLLTVGAFFIPRKSNFVMFVAYFALTGAFLFLIFQFFLFVDLVETFIDFWIDISDDTKRTQKPTHCALFCVISCISLAFLGVTPLLACALFFYTSREKCKWNDIFIGLNLGQCFVAFVLSLHTKVRPRLRPAASLLPCAVITLYTVLLVLLAVTSQQEVECNLADSFLQGYDLQIGPNIRSLVAATLGFIALIYASIKTPSNTYITKLLKGADLKQTDDHSKDTITEKNLSIEHENQSSRDLYGVEESRINSTQLKTTMTYTFEENASDDYNYTCFHLLISSASLYLLMNVTNWYGPVQSPFGTNNQSRVVGLRPGWWPAELTTRIASCTCVLLYIFLMLWVITRKEGNRIKDNNKAEKIESFDSVRKEGNIADKPRDRNEIRGISFREAIRNLNITNPDYRSPSPEILLEMNGKLSLSCYQVDKLQVMYWHFPRNISQSYYGGRNGSNACTIIAMLIARLFYQSGIAAPAPAVLPEMWISVFVKCISEGNKLYDGLVNTKEEGAITLAVEDVAEYFGEDFGISDVDCPLPVTFKSDIETETLVFQLNKHKALNRRQCLMFIKDFRTGVFLIQEDGFLLFADSHPYGSGGAMLVSAPSGSAEHLGKFLQAVLLSRTDTLGTITSVKFLQSES